MDIHMHIVNNGEIIRDDIFDGRNSEWFNNLQNRGYDFEYKDLPTEWGISPQAPPEFMDYQEKDYYFGFFYVSVKKYKEWFIKYRPDKDAGYVSTYDKWRMENKNYVPYDTPSDLSTIEEYMRGDMHFVEYEKEYDSSRWLYEYLIDNNIPEDADITYWFDW